MDWMKDKKIKFKWKPILKSKEFKDYIQSLIDDEKIIDLDDIIFETEGRTVHVMEAVSWGIIYIDEIDVMELFNIDVEIIK